MRARKVTHLPVTTMRRLRRAALAATGLALLGGSACALFRGPEKEGPSHGGLPQDVRATPAATSLGPVTAATPVQPDVTPPPPGETPLGTVDVNRPGVALVREDSATRALRLRLDSVLVATSGDLTQVPIPVARAMVDGFRRFLAGHRDPRVAAVREELSALHEALGRSPIDGHAVGHVLERLGTRTTAAASAAGVLSGRVALLGDRLQERGRVLSGKSK